MKKLLSVLMIFAMVFAFAACGGKEETETTAADNAATEAATNKDGEAVTPDDGLVETVEPKGTVIGSYDPGEIAFYWTVINKAGEEKLFTVYTSEANLGAALLKTGMIDGDMGDYGLTVKTVNGETHNYETEGYAWMIYVGDEQAQTGVDEIILKDGASYTFKVETF